MTKPGLATFCDSLVKDLPEIINGVARHQNSDSSQISAINEKQETKLSRYLGLCERYKCRADAGVLVCLRHQSTHLIRSEGFSDLDLLPLADLGDIGLTYLDLSDGSISVNGARVLCEILVNNNHLEIVELKNNRLMDAGARLICETLARNRFKNLTHLGLSTNMLTFQSVDSLAVAMHSNVDTEHINVDVSQNYISYTGLKSNLLSYYNEFIHSTEDVMNPNMLQENFAKVLNTMNTEGNFAVEQLLSAITHGFGIVLGIIGYVIMVKECNHHQCSTQATIAINVFCISIICLYTASTLYHSFYCCPSVAAIFRYIDYAMIFVLIAGTYTPILLIAMKHSPFHSYGILAVIWSLACFGILNVLYANWSLTLYIVLGWLSVCFLFPLYHSLGAESFYWLGAGGLSYTGGIFFLVDETDPFNHVIWHVFVLCGTFCHYIMIHNYVVPFDLVVKDPVPLDFQTLFNNSIGFGFPLYELLVSYFFGSPVADAVMGNL